MKKKKSYMICSILDFISGICFLIVAIIYKEQRFSAEAPRYAQWIGKYGFYIAGVCLLIAGAGFLYTYFKNGKE